jgi:hypothetical protein
MRYEMWTIGDERCGGVETAATAILNALNSGRQGVSEDNNVKPKLILEGEKEK